MQNSTKRKVDNTLNKQGSEGNLSPPPIYLVNTRSVE